MEKVNLMRNKVFLFIQICLLFSFCFIEQMSAQEPLLNKEEKINLEIQKLKEQINNTPGTYKINLRYQTSEGEVVEEQIQMTISGGHTKTNHSEGINAEDALITKQQVKNFNDQDWIKLTKANAWSKTDNTSLKITSVNTTTIKAEAGIYPITFSLPSGLSTTSYITVIDNQVIYNDNVEAQQIFPEIKFIQVIILPLILVFLALPFLIYIGQYIEFAQVVKKIEHLLYEKILKNKL